MFLELLYPWLTDQEEQKLSQKTRQLLPCPVAAVAQ